MFLIFVGFVFGFFMFVCLFVCQNTFTIIQVEEQHSLPLYGDLYSFWFGFHVVFWYVVF